VDEGALVYSMALRYAARARYDLATTLIDDFISEYPSNPLREQAQELRTDVDRLADSKEVLFQSGTLAYDRSGRTNLLIYSGFYGIWAAIAAPSALEAENAEAYAAALLTIPATSVYVAYRLSKNTDMGKGRAGIISLSENRVRLINLGASWARWLRVESRYS
jgi:hypothetical protein